MPLLKSNLARAILWCLSLAIILLVPAVVLFLAGPQTAIFGLYLMLGLTLPVSFAAAYFLQGIDAILLTLAVTVLAWVALVPIFGQEILGALGLTVWVVGVELLAGTFAGMAVRRLVKRRRSTL